MRFFHSEQAEPKALHGLRVSVIGYGRLGRSMALNLVDSNVDVLIGNRDDERKAKALEDGFEVVGIEQACDASDIIFVLLADEVIADVFNENLLSRIKDGAMFVFASGYCLAFDLVKLPAYVDIAMIAPRMLGDNVRSCYLKSEGFVAYCSVEQDATGLAQQRMLALANATGCLRRGALELSAAKEALLDLMIEQTVGPYLGTCMQMAFAMGVEAGLPPEAMVLELYGSSEMARTFEAFAAAGFYKSVQDHGVVATYGGFLRSMELDSSGIRSHFASVIGEISRGEFATRLQAEAKAGYPTLKAIENMTRGTDPMSLAEQRLRGEMGGFGEPPRCDPLGPPADDYKSQASEKQIN